MHLRTLEVESIMCVLLNSSRIKECHCNIIGGMQYCMRFGTVEFNDIIYAKCMEGFGFLYSYIKVLYYIQSNF